MIVSYRPWTYEGINLKNYVGQTLTVVITNSDCALGGHYCYSYWDFSCGCFPTYAPPYCLGNSVSLSAPTNPVIPYTYQWYQNENPIGTSQTIFPYPQPGDTFAVKISQGSGCPFYITYVPVPMFITPDFNFTGTGSCGSGLFSFRDSSRTPTGVPMVSWQWSFPGGTPSSSTAQNPSNISYPPGTHQVTLIVTSQEGCRDTITLPLNIPSLTIVPDFNYAPTGSCGSGLANFTDSSYAPGGSPMVSWNWSFPGGTPASSTSQNPTNIMFAPGGSYNITLIVTAQNGCTDTVTLPINIPNGIPPIALAASNAVCFNNPTVFADQSTGNPTVAAWNWTFGDPGSGSSNISTAQNPSHTYGVAGSFTATLIITNTDGCKDTTTLTTIVHPLPLANFTSPPVCIGNQTCFTNSSQVPSPGSITGWSWIFGDPASGAANTSSAQAPCHTFSAAGNFSVILTVTSDNNCQNTITLPTTVYPPPVAVINPQNVCVNAVTVLSNSSTAAPGDPISTYDWNFGDGTANSSQNNPSHTYTTPGTYNVTLIVTSVNGCKDTTTIPVMLYRPPVANFSDSASGCSPVCQTFTDLSTSADGTIASWQWSFPGGNPSSASSANPSACWVPPGTYDVQLIVTSSFGCKDTLFIPQYIRVYPTPTADFLVTPPKAPATDPLFYISDMWSSDGNQWNWYFGDNSTDNVNTDPIHSYSASISGNDFYTFNICLKVSNPIGCSDSICKIVELIPEFTFYIANTFTPNSDFINEMFFGKGRGIKEYNIWLFDRWGNQIWDCHREDKNTNWDNPGQDGLASACQWDGEVVKGGLDMNGNSRQLAQEDVYVWKVRLTDVFDRKHTYIGHVNIVR